MENTKHEPEIENTLLRVLQPFLTKCVETATGTLIGNVRELGNEMLAERLTTLTDQVKALKNVKKI